LWAHSVLNDQSLNSVWMGQCHAKTHGPAVILHVEGVARKPERFGEVTHDFGVVIECICEALRVGPIAVSKARVIGRDEVIEIGQTAQERLEHSG
jgi:hypothetical protein